MALTEILRSNLTRYPDGRRAHPPALAGDHVGLVADVLKRRNAIVANTWELDPAWLAEGRLHFRSLKIGSMPISRGASRRPFAGLA